MRTLKTSNWRPLVTAFTIWFGHFMGIWAAGEIWPHQRTANAFAWGVTVIALLAMGVHYARIRARHANGELPDWTYRFAEGATAIATTAVVFGFLPSIVFLP